MLLADRARFPRDKPCGGGLTGRALKQAPVDVTPVVERVVDTFELRLHYKRNFQRTSTEPLILSLLAQGENYGYALIQKVREMSSDRIRWTDGILYPVLHRLEKQGRIKSRWKTAETGRKRKYYSIKKEGRMALAKDQEQWRVVHETLNLLWRPENVRSGSGH